MTKVINPNYEEMPICPNPGPWHEIYMTLKMAKEIRESRSKGKIRIPDPPDAMILSRWQEEDSVKHAQWLKTLEWALKHDFIHIIIFGLEREDFYISTR
jgi:hypothetical protein